MIFQGASLPQLEARLQEVLGQRVSDGVLRRAVGKWLKAGVLEDWVRRTSDTGPPRGGVISPILANIYLDEVLDQWYERDVRPRLRGRSALVRYADDFVLVFEHEGDVRRVMAVLPKRLARFGLTLHPEKTRLLDFRHPWRKPPNPADPPASPEPRSLDIAATRG